VGYTDRKVNTVLQRVAMLAMVILQVVGCSTSEYQSVPAYNRYSAEDIIAMARAGETSNQIIAKLQAANGFYPLRARDLVRLHDQGVPLEVLDYLQDTYVRGVRREERFQLPQRFGGPF
jgi:hypothetical protein